MINKIRGLIQAYLFYRMFEKDGQVRIKESEDKK